MKLGCWDACRASRALDETPFAHLAKAACWCNFQVASKTHHFLPIVAVLILLVVFSVPLAIALTAIFAVNVLVQSRPVGSLSVRLWAVHGCAALAALSQQLMRQA